jgi:hypothetical protein
VLQRFFTSLVHATEVPVPSRQRARIGSPVRSAASTTSPVGFGLVVT